jgi:hypothetical protein
MSMLQNKIKLSNPKEHLEHQNMKAQADEVLTILSFVCIFILQSRNLKGKVAVTSPVVVIGYMVGGGDLI